MNKMSKANATEPNILDVPDLVKISALRNEINYWKLRYELYKKYGDNRIQDW